MRLSRARLGPVPECVGRVLLPALRRRHATVRVSDFILNVLVERGVDTVFGITGGFIAPLFEAFHDRKDIRYICTQHEQAAAMAADAYARLKGFGCAIATSGPGGTNMLTGIACSWFDSIPVLYITGQVPTYEARKTAVRQRGFQETDIVSIVKPVTKYASQVSNPRNVIYELDRAIWEARSGRPGPVLLDFPMDVLRAEMPDDPLRFYPPTKPKPQIAREVSEAARILMEARRPVIVYGQGARHARKELLEFIELTDVPCLPSWAALDLIPHDHKLFISQFGIYGSRAGNFTVQNADLILAIGTRLDTRMTGKDFAPKAKKVVVDLDIDEAMKCNPDVMVIADTKDFLDAILPTFRDMACFGVGRATPEVWHKQIAAWKAKYPIANEKIRPPEPIRLLMDMLPPDAIVVADAGANLSWVHQLFHARGTQRLFSAYGNSPMGYALPAAIGAWAATGKAPVCIIGDGGIQMNIQELQTLAHYNIPVKIFVINNHGYGIMKQFQEEIFDSHYEASEENNPIFTKVAAAYGITAWQILDQSYADFVILSALKERIPFLVDMDVDPRARIFPKCTFGNPLHNQSPLLPPEEVKANMI